MVSSHSLFATISTPRTKHCSNTYHCSSACIEVIGSYSATCAVSLGYTWEQLGSFHTSMSPGPLPSWRGMAKRVVIVPPPRRDFAFCICERQEPARTEAVRHVFSLRTALDVPARDSSDLRVSRTLLGFQHPCQRILKLWRDLLPNQADQFAGIAGQGFHLIGSYKGRIYSHL